MLLIKDGQSREGGQSNHGRMILTTIAEHEVRTCIIRIGNGRNLCLSPPPSVLTQFCNSVGFSVKVDGSVPGQISAIYS